MSQKKRKIRNKQQTKQYVNKVKFVSIANIKSTWTEIKEFYLPTNIKKETVDYKKELLKDDFLESQKPFNSKILNINANKPLKLQ